MSVNANVSRRSGFALIELLTVVALAFLTLSLLTPAVLQSRAAARREQCADALKRLALGVQCYHDANNAHPIGQDGNDLDYGFRVALLPYLGETATYGVATRYRADGVRFGETGPDLREKRFDFYACPADPAAQTILNGCAPASYVACYGDYCPKVEPWNAETYAEAARFAADKNVVARNSRLFRNGSRGAIQPKIWSGVVDVIDGTSNTALFSETLVAVPRRSRRRARRRLRRRARPRLLRTSRLQSEKLPRSRRQGRFRRLPRRSRRRPSARQALGRRSPSVRRVFDDSSAELAELRARPSRRRRSERPTPLGDLRSLGRRQRRVRRRRRSLR